MLMFEFGFLGSIAIFWPCSALILPFALFLLLLFGIVSYTLQKKFRFSLKVFFSPKKSIKSPIVGTAYLAPEPGAKKFVEVGKKIKKGDTVVIVEAMKTMNHIPSSQDGTIKKICVEDGQPVEFGQNLIIFE